MDFSETKIPIQMIRFAQIQINVMNSEQSLPPENYHDNVRL